MDAAMSESSSSPSKIIETPSSQSSKGPPQLTPKTMPGEDEPTAGDYRPSRSLPRTLINHCRIYLEDQLFFHAIELANSLLTSGPAVQNGQVSAAFVLPPVQLGFINNLLIHPKHTSRPETVERREIAALALVYLENLLQMVGPVNANFAAAFSFNPNYTPRPRARRALNPDDDLCSDDFDDDGEDEENARIVSKLDNEESIWNCGHDFWSVLGWAFNCSVIHPSRWRWWRMWLDFMLRVLEEDLRERFQLDELADEQRGCVGEYDYHMMRQSLIAIYATRRGGRTNGVKWVVKALFADGQQASLSLFTEVFPLETKDLPRGQNKRKREPALDLEHFKYADYGDTDDELEESGPEDETMSLTSTPRKPGRHHNEVPLTKFEHYQENAEALHDLVPYRLRAMSLLSQLAFSMPKLFATLEDLHEEFALGMKELPLPLFTAMITPSSAHLMDKDYVVLLLRELLHLFLPPKYLDPSKVDKEADREGRITQEILARCLLPHAADTSSVEDNAKLSFLLETVMMMLLEDGQLRPKASLTEAARAGIAAREKKAKVKRYGRTGRLNEYDVLAKKVLDESGAMINRILEAL
ncbi:hypothetical protein jhhlp_004652 [Lomentospora prolificans]|uniref:Uncharacterized protein n=1 Tax=Lomentospora prolificans TaxID=41688 RepID=A0A2N3NCA2_9PEZI|nr:hypothetical protein jhhlp_004652 [Lomentospora prolificans]